MADRLHRAAFDDHRGSTFTVVATGIPGALDRPVAPVELELTGIEDRSTDEVEAFSLFFRGPRQRLFDQGNYRLRHEALGEVDLFLVPILDPRPPDDRIAYQAVFCRLRE